MKYLPNGGLEYYSKQSVTWPINGAGSTNLSINSHANLLTRANHGIFFCGLFLIYVEWIINKYDKEIPSVVNLKANIINKFIEQTNQCAILHNIRLNVFHSSQIGSRFCKLRSRGTQPTWHRMEIGPRFGILLTIQQLHFSISYPWDWALFAISIHICL